MSFIHETTLRPAQQTRECRSALEDAAIEHLGHLHKNGQIWGDYLTSWADGCLYLVAKAPSDDSLEPQHRSKWAEESLARLREHCQDALSWRSRGSHDSPRRSSADWAQCESFYLFTHAFDDTSPVVAGDNGDPVPLYLLPIEPELREGLLFWMSSYRHHDSIWLDSRELEDAAYGQLSDARSELSLRGRALAAELEVSVGRPTYYYLQRYHALPDGEAVRPCPGCGRSWARISDSTTRGMGWFDFACDACRLVSHQGVNVPDESGP